MRRLRLLRRAVKLARLPPTLGQGATALSTSRLIAHDNPVKKPLDLCVTGEAASREKVRASRGSAAALRPRKVENHRSGRPASKSKSLDGQPVTKTDSGIAGFPANGSLTQANLA